MFHMPLSGDAVIEQTGGAATQLTQGLVYADPCEVPGIIRFQGEPTEGFYVSIPRAHLAAATAGLNSVLRNTAQLTPQWRLFFGYARSLQGELAGLSPEETAKCATHIQDLALMALGAMRDAAEIAAGRGVRAARMKAIRADIEAHLTSTELDGNWLAARHGISPRYLRALFAGEDTSLSDYVALRRLALAYHLLTDARFAGHGIVQIALSAGFGDLSWFNTRFRRVYGMTPKDARANAMSLSPKV